MIFTNADPRYASRFDNKQGGDTIVTMERVREALAFNAELVDKSTWLYLPAENGIRKKKCQHLLTSIEGQHPRLLYLARTSGS